MNDVDITPCWVYASERKEDMYLYVASEEGIDDLPEELMSGFGAARLVMTLDLHAQRPLARADVKTVLKSLEEEGFYLQMPPELKPHLYHGNED